MKDEKDYIRDIADIRSMMERSSKFLFLSGWTGIMAGIYALVGAYIVSNLFQFNPDETGYGRLPSDSISPELFKIIGVAVVVLILAVATAYFHSYKKAEKRGEKLWNATTRMLLVNMAVPFVAGGILIIIMLTKGLVGFIAPLSLLFYGLALYNISKLTMKEVRYLGISQIVLGLISSYYIEYGMIMWALGFGVVHIIYGIYMFYRYER